MIKRPDVLDVDITKVNQEFIEIVGIETNNLKSINVRIPLHKITSVTGVSGSGKSSLVFDTLYAEAYRRYVESLSSFARQYLKALPKPKIESIKHLPPAIAVRQTRSGATNRSTVGTLTELLDTLRIIFSQKAEIFCFKCNQKVLKAEPDQIADVCIQEFSSENILVLAPIAHLDSVSDVDLKSLLSAQGFTRIEDGKNILRLDEVKTINKKTSYVVIDRISAIEENRKRISEASSLGLRLGGGDLVIKSPKLERSFSRRLRCCDVDYVMPTMALFNFNHPLGACYKCQGFGSMSVLDETKILPDMSGSLASDGVAPWNFGEHVVCYDEAFKSASSLKMSSNLKKKQFNQYSEIERNWLWNGDGKKFNGIRGYFDWLDSKRYKPHYRIHAARFKKYVTCEVCFGKRLNEKALACRILNVNIAEVAAFDIGDSILWIDKLSQPSSFAERTLQVDEALLEARSRLSYLERMGLGYLSLDRAAPSLSGGELQRINMSRCLGSVLTETLFCLDEPSAGLHAKDSANLLLVMKDLQNLGNTVVVVEHEKLIIRGSDHFIEIGPKAGHEGGHVVFEGDPKKLKNEIGRGILNSSNQSKSKNLSDYKDFIELSGAKIHNLINVCAKFPVGKVTAICGVSGSGKTSLIKHTLFPLLESFFEAKETGKPDIFELTSKSLGIVSPAKAILMHKSVDLVSQTTLGRSSRSTIVTYLGLMDEIRKILANTEMAKALKLGPGSFSFNVPGGRCETCRGLGTVVEDLSFLGDMEISCPVCSGRRFQEKVLSVKYKNKNLIEILGLTVAEARMFFFDKPSLASSLDAVIDVGMGYVALGQNTSSFSGGEAQRLKLVQIMREAKRGHTSVLIFDEPTTGLSDLDVSKLMTQFFKLAALGHTVLIVEHHLDVLRGADWLIELGPGASKKGGRITYQGIPEGIRSAQDSATAAYMFEN